MRSAITLTAITLALIAAIPAAAQTQNQISACRGDAMRLCPSHIGNRDAMRACMRANRDKVSETCKASIRG